MDKDIRHISRDRSQTLAEKILLLVICVSLVFPADLLAQVHRRAEPVRIERSEAGEPDEVLDVEAVVEDPDLAVAGETEDSVLVEVRAPGYSPEYGLRRPFNPEPNKAVWMSALLPGLGQIYNRRYWKLPIIVAGYMGLGYATSWNNSQLTDYNQAYADLLDADPNTNSYMNLFPPTSSEADIDKTWLQSTLKSRKNFYRRNRDLCIICMVGLYLLCMVDAYVDATMAHFDISPNLSLDIQPAMFQTASDRLPAVGVQWALNF